MNLSQEVSLFSRFRDSALHEVEEEQQTTQQLSNAISTRKQKWIPLFEEAIEASQ
jgi:hypothetical protein